jgi:hypothetical protein
MQPEIEKCQQFAGRVQHEVRRRRPWLRTDQQRCSAVCGNGTKGVFIRDVVAKEGRGRAVSSG